MTMKLEKQIMINTVGNVAYLAAQWYLTVLTTRIIGYDAAGTLTLAMSVGNVFTFIQMYGVRSFQSSDTVGKYTPGDYFLARLLTTAAGLVLCVGFLQFAGYSLDLSLSVLLFTLFRTSEAISDVFFGDLQRKGRLELVGITMFVRGVLTASLFTAAITCFRNLNQALLVLALGAAALTLLLDRTMYLRLVSEMGGSMTGCKKIIRECFPLLVAVLLPSVVTAFPRILLERYNGAELLGYYGNISTPAVIITALVPNILSAFMPVYGEMAQNGEYEEMRKLWGKTMLGTLAILMGCLLGAAALAKPVLAWLYTDAILPYVHYLYFFLVSTALYAMTMCGGAALIADRKNGCVSLSSLLCTAVCIILSFPLVRVYAIPGAIAVLVISYLIQNALQAVYIFRMG